MIDTIIENDFEMIDVEFVDKQLHAHAENFQRYGPSMHEVPKCFRKTMSFNHHQSLRFQCDGKSRF